MVARYRAQTRAAVADDWAAVRKYEVTGSNSYSKMVTRYREDLLAVRKAPLGFGVQLFGHSVPF
jgi:hypothetical protein